MANILTTKTGEKHTMACGLLEGYDARRHSHGNSSLVGREKTSLTSGPPSLFGGKHSASFNMTHHCSGKTTEGIQGIAWPPMSPAGRCPQEQRIHYSLGKTPLTPAVCGTARPSCPAKRHRCSPVLLSRFYKLSANLEHSFLDF